jgi:hypothetical protein
MNESYTAGARWAAWLLAVAAAAALAGLWFVDPAKVAAPVCGLHAATGLHCPGCGATRATHALLHGRCREAARHNALWVATIPLAVYAATSEWRRRRTGRPLPGNLSQQAWFYVGYVAVAFVFGVVRNLPWPPFDLLAP